MEVECNVWGYRLEGDTLNGIILLEITKDVLERYHEL